MSEVFSSDFETNLDDFTVTGAPTLEAGQGYNGTQGLQMEQAAERVRRDLAVPLALIWVGFWFKAVDTAVDAINTFCQMLSNDVFPQTTMRFNANTGYLDVLTAADAGKIIGSVADSGMQDGEWHFVEWFVENAGVINGKITVHIDDVEVIQETGVETFGTAGPPLDNFQFYGTGADRTRMFDDLYIDDAEFHGMPVAAGNGEEEGDISTRNPSLLRLLGVQ